MTAVVWFFAYGKVAFRAASVLGPVTHFVLVPAGLLLTAVVLRVLLRRPVVLERGASFLSLTGGFLTAWLVSAIVLQRVRAGRELQENPLVRRLAQPIPAKAKLAGGSRSPDIYLLLVDEYANSSVLRERFNYDNGDFEDSLRRLGFFIPAVVHSNYAHTLLSIPSLLNASHLVDLGTHPGAGSNDPTIPNHLVESSRGVRFLTDRGYHYVFFPSQWWLPTRQAPQANLNYRTWAGLSLDRELTGSDFRRTVRRLTMLDLLYSDYESDADYLKRTFAGLAGAPSVPGPRLVFAHLIDPHFPYVFDRECRPKPRPTYGHRQDRKRAYLDQLHCLNGMLLEVVATVIRSSPEPPIILIQGDHGTNTLGASDAPAAAAVPPAAVRERLGAFGAYYLPGGGAQAFGDTVTVVNVLGNVLRHYFGADLPREPDDLYFSVEGEPYRFRTMTGLR